MTEQQSSYRQIMKATSIFGGVQIFQIIIAIIRSKIIAVLLGPAGMGVAGLLNSTILFIGASTNFGLGTSAVRNVSEANATGNIKKLSRVVIVVKRLMWITGTLGAAITLALSPWLSQLTFGNRHYTLAFIWISITLLFNQLSIGQMVLLRGMRKLKHLAKANLTGSSIGLIITIPVYYKWGIDGIVPGIIITSLVALFFSWFYSRNILVEQVEVSRAETITEGKAMLTLGFMISLSSMISLGASYLIRIFISNTGGVEQVGLYTAGFTMINTYVGLIFTSMATDYYPKLSAVSHSNVLSRDVMNQQAEIALLILAPILIIFLVFIKWLIILLYSTKFIPIDDMILWAALGIFFKAASWSVSYILLAKGASRVFFWNELIANTYILGLNILGYYYWGLTGLGISFMIAYLIYSIQVFLIARTKYQFSFSVDFKRIFVIQFMIAAICLLVVKMTSNLTSYTLGSLLIILSVIYSYIELDKRLDLKSIIISIKNKIWK